MSPDKSMEVLIQILSIFLLGLIGGASPGPILTASFMESLRKGFLKSLYIIFIAMIAESIVAIFILLLFFTIHIPKEIFYIISLVGAGVLIWLATQVQRIEKIGGEGEVFSVKKIFLLTVFNGPFWIFWITICAPQAFLLKEKIAGGHILFLIIFELGWLSSALSLTFIFSRFRSLLVKSNFVSIVFKIFSLILLFFAVRLVVQSVAFLLNRF